MNQIQSPEQALFEPLVAALTAGRYLRVVARPSWVTGDPAFGPCLPLPDTAWSAEQHARARAACITQATVGEGIRAQATGDGIVVSWVPQAFLPADLVREQVISPLAMRLLSAAVALGRNLLITGSYNAALPLIYALVGEGARPALIGADFVAIPRRWLRLEDLADATRAHADRIGVCGVPMASLVEITCGLCGVVAFNPSRRLEQALMRYELGAAALAGKHNTPLHVLAGVDLVVQASVQGACQVTQIAEITLTDTGYRPQILFGSGLPPTPQALMPRAPPSFVHELALAGHVGLAEELSQLAPPSAAGPPPASAAQAQSRLPERPASSAERPSRQPPVRPWPTPRAVPKDADMRPPDSLPGWELDRLPAPEAATGTPQTASADDAMLAATYGLAPPPRPTGARGVRSFDEALSRARPVPSPADGVDNVEEALPHLPPDGDRPKDPTP